MQYYKADSAISPIEGLLDRVAANDSDVKSGEPVPTLDEFLEEEDILRQCRGDNKRLIAYLCRPEIIYNLVAHSIKSKQQSASRLRPASSLASNSANAVIDEKPPSDESTAANDESEDTTTDAARDESTTEASKPNDSNPMKYPYVASELLSADIRELCDAAVTNDSVMDLLFSLVEDSEVDHLDPFVAGHFSKVLCSLLKTRNTQTLRQMHRRGRTLTDGLIKHIALGPISELIVRLLDAPDPEQTFDNSIHPPTPGALGLLTGADLLNGLAESFVSASHPPGDSESHSANRHREETLANVTATITGLTERILQLPPLGVQIPQQLSAYHSPKAIVRLLDAGLFAAMSSSPISTVEPGSPVSINTSSVVLSGNYSALLHSLGLAANLMTTKSNIWEEDKPTFDLHRNSSRDSTDDSAEEVRAKVESNGAEDDGAPADGTGRDIPMSSLLKPRTPGENILSTSHLEQELVVRFQRLARMFGTLEADAGSKVPLGLLRLKLAEFFTACMKKASRNTVEHIIELGVPKKLLELFLQYEWSSMLHGVVTSSIIAALSAGMSGLPARIAWFDAQLVSWLLNAWSSNEEDGERQFRAGYMGHLIKIGVALRDFVMESEATNKEALLQLVSDENLTKFKAFAEESLAPAHRIEHTPLCNNDSESEEIYEDEPTDLLEMGVGEVIEGLTQGDPDVAIRRFSKFLLHKSGGNIDAYDEEEDIQTVDVGDLSHFPDDDEIEESLGVDHDIPPEIHRQIYERQRADTRNDLGAVPPPPPESNGVMPLKDDDDDGTYMAHISKTTNAGSGTKEVETLSVNFKESVQIVEPLPMVHGTDEAIMPIPSPSLEVDAAVTEIDEPQPVTPGTFAGISALKHETPLTAVDSDDSSDEDLGEWVAFNADEIAAGKITNSSSNDDHSRAAGSQPSTAAAASETRTPVAAASPSAAVPKIPAESEATNS